MGPEIVYEVMVNELMSSLHHEVLIIGLFVVCFGYLRHAMRERGLLKDMNFWQHIVLLSAVMLFSSYISITYFLEGEISLSKTDIQEKIAHWSSAEREHAQMLVVVMLPIDLLGILCMASFFMVLAKDEFFYDNAPNAAYSKINNVLFPLFLLTGMWHLLMVLWWAVFSGFGKRDLATGDIQYHAIYFVCHLLCGFGLRSITRYLDPKTLFKPLFQWSGVVVYVFLVISVYAYRTYQHIGSAIQR